MEKTISFVILIIIGVLFRSKVQNKEQKDTIKTLILAVALPAVIFSALLKIDLTSSLIYPPLLVLSFNLILFFLVRWGLPVLMGGKIDKTNARTLMLMLPSLAPYLSCFPFIAEFSNDSIIGLAAISDTGNKIFILLFLYFLAMYWAYGKQVFGKQKGKSKSKLTDILLQPINLSIIIALTASLLGIKLETIPVYFQESLGHLRNLLTPTILIFIGLAVKVKGKELRLILGLLLWRSAIAFTLSALLISLCNFNSLGVILLVVAFPQSSCSFIPYAQMTILSDRHERDSIFNLGLALSLLAISLPFSAFTIVSVYTSGDFFTSPLHLIELAVGAFLVSCVLLRQKVQNSQLVAAASERVSEESIPRAKKTTTV